jgi:hypothetical protein
MLLARMWSCTAFAWDDGKNRQGVVYRRRGRGCWSVVWVKLLVFAMGLCVLQALSHCALQPTVPLPCWG